MPMTVTPDNREAWLDPGNNVTDRIRSLLASPPPVALKLIAPGIPAELIDNQLLLCTTHRAVAGQ
jgi:hypothetical protein